VSIGLLDVNMLVALGWSSHAHHEVARDWIERNRDFGWATCPITQNAFARISSNTAFTPDAVAPSMAVQLLRNLTHTKGHVFWPDDMALVDLDLSGMILGHKQVTDVYLLGLAKYHSGRLVTLDQKIASMLPRASRLLDHLEVLSF
jgi:toxin-antitoxin system PIN domain toxin